MRLTRCGLMAGGARSDDTIIWHPINIIRQCVSIETEHKSQSHARRRSFIKNEFVIIIVTVNISFQFKIDYSLRRRFLGLAIWCSNQKPRLSRAAPHHVHVSLFASLDRLVIKRRRVCYNGKANRNIISYSTPEILWLARHGVVLNINWWVAFDADSVVFWNQRISCAFR